MRYIKRVVIETTGVCNVTLRLLRYTLIGVCTDTNVIYQSVLEKKTDWSYVSQRRNIVV